MSDEQTNTADPVTELALEKIQAAYPGVVVASETGGKHPWIQITPQSLRDVIRFLKDTPGLLYDSLHLLSGVDWPGKKDEVGEQEAVYHLVSYTNPPPAGYGKRKLKNDPWLCIKVRVPRDKPEVPTVMDIHTGADWHERETYDLVGIVFTGRDELRRILLPEDWPGHPLKKDWVYPASYHGIPIVPPEGM